MVPVQSGQQITMLNMGPYQQHQQQQRNGDTSDGVSMYSKGKSDDIILAPDGKSEDPFKGTSNYSI